MTDEATAIRVALDLLRVPSRVRQHRSQPLPAGVTGLLHIAAGDLSAEREAALSIGESPAVLREAAAFFIEQILLAPDSDSYRVLGASPNATTVELRRNMGLLLKGMHPDVEDGVRSLFAHRVTSAWDTLKTPDRRAVYDLTLQQSQTDKRPPKKKSRRARLRKNWLTRQSVDQTPHAQTDKALAIHRAAPEGLLHRVLRLLLAGVRA